MRTLIVIAVVFLLAPWVRSLVTPEHVLLTRWPNGNQRTYVISVLDGSGRFVREGRFLSYYETGALACEGTYRRGKRQGLWRWWHDTGELLARCFYQDDEGVMTSWNKDGTLLHQGPLRIETRHGIWTEYYPSGRKRLVGGFFDGIKDGTWIHYTDEDSPQIITATWDRGRRLR